MISKKILITDKTVLNRILYWLNFQPSIYNPTVRTIIRNGAIFGIELTPPKEKLDFINETNNVLFYFYKNNDLENLPKTPTQTGAEQPKTSYDNTNFFNFDTSNVRGSQSVTTSGPQKPTTSNIVVPSSISENLTTTNLVFGSTQTDESGETPCDCEDCYGICCRPSGVSYKDVVFTGLVTDLVVDATGCDNNYELYLHKYNNALIAKNNSNIINMMNNNGWKVFLEEDLNLSEEPSCDKEAELKITFACYGEIDPTGTISNIDSTDYASVSYPDGSFNVCNCGSGDRIFDEELTKADCENMCGNWLPYCLTSNCEIQAITNVTFNNNGLNFDISKVILQPGSQDLNIIPVLNDIDITTYENKIGFNVGVGNLEPSSTGNIIIPITNCDTNYSSEYVQFSPPPSEIMIITNVVLNTSDNPGLVFEAISVTGTIDSTEQKTIPISSCN